jgi:hypothetical protein
MEKKMKRVQIYQKKKMVTGTQMSQMRRISFMSNRQLYLLELGR